MATFSERIASMNAMYRLPVNVDVTIPDNTSELLVKFKKTLTDEVNEIDDIVEMAKAPMDLGTQLDVGTAIADLLCDIIVYCRSEAMKYGLPMERIMDIVMDSNESKLGEDGNPIYDANGKFLKGPNYWKPESEIKELLYTTLYPF